MTDPKDKPLTLKFAPGCFDDWDGTPEELQELITQIRQLVDDGSILEHSHPVPDEETEEIMARLAERQAKRQ